MYGKNYDNFYYFRLYSFTFRLLPQLGVKVTTCKSWRQFDVSKK